jgi:hypothetical protein
MAGDETTLKNELKAAYDKVNAFDGSAGKTAEDAKEELASVTASAVVKWLDSVSFSATPAAIATAGMSNGGGPVVAASNLTLDLIQ